MFQSLNFENLRTAWVFHYMFDVGLHLDVLFSLHLLFDGSGALFVFLFLCHNEVVPDVIFPEAFDLFLQFAGSNPAVPECILNFLLCQTCWVFGVPSFGSPSCISCVHVLSVWGETIILAWVRD